MASKDTEPQIRLVLVFGAYSYQQNYPESKQQEVTQSIDQRWAQAQGQQLNPCEFRGANEVMGLTHRSLAKFDLRELTGYWWEDIMPMAELVPGITDADFRKLTADYYRECIRMFKRQQDDGDNWKDQG